MIIGAGYDKHFLFGAVALTLEKSSVTMKMKLPNDAAEAIL